MFNRRKKVTNKLQRNQLKGASLISFTDPHSVVAEQFRALRTNIEFTLVENEWKSLLVSSSIPAEGKSTISSNLAYVLGQNGKKVLIIDADLRKPNVHRTFKLNNGLGLSSLLSTKEMDFDNVIHHNKELGLYILPSGPIPPNPFEMLNSKRMSTLIEEFSKHFDYVIYDAPPITAVADAKILASKVDGVLLVARDGYSKKEEFRRSKLALDNVNARILGYVMNSHPGEASDYGYYDEK